jgi:hypothetical protein
MEWEAEGVGAEGGRHGTGATAAALPRPPVSSSVYQRWPPPDALRNDSSTLNATGSTTP